MDVNTPGVVTAIRRFDGRYAFLSNFYPSAVLLDGFAYPTVEHAFQAAKSREPAHRVACRNVATPGLAKRLGRQVKLRPDWEIYKTGIMLYLLRQKFTRGSELGLLLVTTGTAELVEGNTWHDQFWGDCRCGRYACRAAGRNELGRQLTQVRDELTPRAR